MSDRSLPTTSSLRTNSAIILCALAVTVWLPRAFGQMPDALPKHITPETAQAIEKGLRFLADRQGRNGAWYNAGNYGTYPVAMTALAGVAFLMDGNTTTQGPYSDAVDRATRFLLSSARKNGLISSATEEGRSMYGHGYSMLFLGQVLGMTEDADRRRQIIDVLERGVDLTGRSQSRDGGWIYTPRSSGDEGSVTITQLQALRSCRNAGVAVPKSIIEKAMHYLELSSRPDGGIAYRARQAGESRPPITAAAVCCYYNAGQYDHPLAEKALEFCKKNIGITGRQRHVIGHYYYAHLYFAQALYLSGPADWDEYFPAMRDNLLKRQSDDGSWADTSVGPVYGTSVALIILQLPNNMVPIMQR